MWHLGTYFSDGLGRVRSTAGPDDLRGHFKLKWFHGSVSIKNGLFFEAAELNILKKCSKRKTHHSSNRKQTSTVQPSAHRISHGYAEINFRCENVGAGHWL